MTLRDRATDGGGATIYGEVVRGRRRVGTNVPQFYVIAA